MWPNLNFQHKPENNFLSLVKEQQKVFRLVDKMTLLDVLDDHKTITTKNGGLVQVIQFEGIDYSGISVDEREALFELRKKFFDNVSGDVKLNFFYLRKNIITKNNDKFSYSSEIADKISKKWSENFKDAFKTEIYLTVKINIPRNIIKAKDLVLKDFNQERIYFFVDKLNSFVSTICKNLAPYHPRVLAHSKIKKSELTNFWSYLINGKDIANSNESVNVGDCVALSDLIFDKEKRVFTLEGESYKRYGRILGVKVYPDGTHEDLLKHLLKTRHRFVVLQQLQPLEQEYNKFMVGRKIKHAQSLMTLGFMRSRLEDLEDAGEALEANKLNFINHNLQILVYADDLDSLEIAVRDVKAALNFGGVTAIAEGSALESSFWSMFPDYEGFNGRKAKITSENISDFITLGSSHEGLNKCSFGESSVALFKTTSHSNYSFTFHNSSEENSLGHTLVIGGSGRGKTTLITFLLMNCLKFQNFKLLAFDSYQGTKIPFTSFGGKYVTVGQEKTLQLNPMLLPNSYSSQTFLEKWIAGLCGGAATHEQKIIAEVVRQNFELDKKDRSLTAVRALAREAEAGVDGKNLAERIEKWLPSEEDNSTSFYNYGMLFNAKTDSLDFSAPIVGFDMASALNDNELLGAISSYIFHCFNQTISNNPSPHVLFIDEMVQYLNNPIFAPYITKGVREIRKRNGVLIGAVQEASAITESPAGKIFINNAATYILFPDPTANPEDYLSSSEDDKSSKVGLGLTDAEFMWIKTSNPEREVMIKRRGGESIILNIDLSCLGPYLKLFSSNIKDIRQFELAIQENKENYVDEYLKRVTIN